MSKLIKLLLTAAIIGPNVCNGDQLEVISLKNRNAEDLIPTLQAILSKDEAISGISNQIILRASDQSRAEIKKLIQQLDVASKQLMISVIQNADADTIRQLASLSGSAELHHKYHTENEINIQANIISTRNNQQQRVNQQIRVLDGGRAFIHTGEQRPRQSTQTIRTHRGIQTISNTDYQSTGSGFYVRPHINGTTVTLEIETQNDQFNYQSQHIERNESQIIGKLGQWLILSESHRENHQQQNSINSQGFNKLNQESRVLVKVEEIK